MVRDSDHQSIPDQYATVADTAPAIVDMIEAGWRVVVTHGEPAGRLHSPSLRACGPRSRRRPVGLCGGDTQGAIGYMFSKETNCFVAHLSTDDKVGAQTVVDRNNKAFAR